VSNKVESEETKILSLEERIQQKLEAYDINLEEELGDQLNEAVKLKA
jgi:hypothetical protein